MTTTTPTRRAGRWGLSALLPALVLWGLSCSSLTSVDAPDILQPGQVDTPDGANVLRVGGLGTFYYDVILYPYGVPGWAGLLSDDLVSGGYDQIAEAADARRITVDA